MEKKKIKIFEQISGNDWVCAEDKKEAFEFWIEENEDESDNVDINDFEEVSQERMKNLTMFEDEEHEKEVTFLEVLESDKKIGRKTPYLFASSNY